MQDFQVALLLEVEGASSGTYAPTTNFSEDEAPVVRPDGSLIPAFRTIYRDAACFKNGTFSFRPTYSLSGRAAQKLGSLTLKVIVNLRPIGGSTTQQNVLFVARYPVNTVGVGSGFPAVPVAACGVLPQATPATVAALCNSTKYRAAIVLSRPGKTAGATPAVPPAVARLQAYPNPATGAVRLRYHLTQAGLVHLTMRDNLGRTVRTVLKQEQPLGTHGTTVALDGLRAGIYYCTLQTATLHQVERLVITD